MIRILKKPSKKAARVLCGLICIYYLLIFFLIYILHSAITVKPLSLVNYIPLVVSAGCIWCAYELRLARVGGWIAIIGSVFLGALFLVSEITRESSRYLGQIPPGQVIKNFLLIVFAIFVMPGVMSGSVFLWLNKTKKRKG